MAKTVVILGAGWAGLPLAHKLLKYTVPKVPGLKVILVSPSSHFFWNVAATRGLIPGEIPDDQLFIPIKPAFEQYPPENFEFVLGTAENIDQTANSVRITLNDGAQRNVLYDQLVIATGSRMRSNFPLKLTGSHETTLAAWKDLQKRVEEAKSIIIAGAGPTGIEVAGEIAAKYGAAKEVTLVMSGDLPLEGSLASVRGVVDKDLQKLGVKLIKSTRVTNSKTDSNGKGTTVTFSNGSTLTAQLYLPLHGITVNTAFVPPNLLDAKSNLNLEQTMQVSGTENIWGIGDVGNIEAKQLTVTDNQIIHLAGALDTVLSGAGAVKAYEPMDKAMIFIALGKRFATGQIGNWKLFGFMVAWVKGRKLFVDTAEGYVGGKYLRHAAM